MKMYIFLIAALSLSSFVVAADENIKDTVEVETTHIKADKELPKVLYVVPWKEMENTKNNDQKLILHDFFGDLYDPVLVTDIHTTGPIATGQPEKAK